MLLNWEPVRNERAELVNPNNPSGMRVPINTGMMGAVPVWKLAEMLDYGAIANSRIEQERIAREGMTRA
ncbi:hypothetical protein [Bradyrhizobium sp. B120]|uniref:hypothetical protein n=1 Tax=Bradyrhizobium sp. B120 TaxID=3410088 RepID=UPI003B985710